MRPVAALFSLLFFITSCVPLKVAPEIDTHKIAIGKKFKKSLPEEYLYIFEDTKEADEFYFFIKNKLKRNNTHLELKMPFEIDGVNYYFSFYETDISGTSIALAPIALDLATRNSDFATDMSDAYSTRTGKWYIAISIIDQDDFNCLEPLYPFRELIVDYLDTMRIEYLKASNYKKNWLNKKP